MAIIEIYNKINDSISNGVKTAIGLFLLVAAVITDMAVGYGEDYNVTVTIIMTAGVLSLVNALFSKIYKSSLSYILFMAGNIAGLFLYLYVISRYEMIGGLFTALFAVLVFVCTWLMEMCLISGAGLKKRILGGLLLNLIVLLFTAISTIVVVSISVIVPMMA